MEENKNEILEAIKILSNKIDKSNESIKILREEMNNAIIKLENRIIILEDSMNEMKQEMSEMKQETSGMKQDISGMKQDISGMKQDISGMKQDISGMKQEMNEMKQEMSEMKQETSGMKQEMNEMKQETSVMKQEMRTGFGRIDEDLNEINKRLKIIEKSAVRMEHEYGYKIDVLYETRYRINERITINEIEIEKINSKLDEQEIKKCI